jgi:hypothetical protein
VEFAIIDAADSQHPEFYGLDASKGLDVIVWQMGKGSYSFALRPHSDGKVGFSLGLRGTTAAEMRNILLTYNVSADDIYIVPWQNPISSYIGSYHDRWVALDDITPYQNMYLAIVRDMILGVSPKNSYPCIYESVYYDIDGDSKKEWNKVCLGLIDGRFMFTYAVSEDGKTLEYCEDFYTAPMSLKFFEDENGKLRLRGVTEDGVAHIYEITLQDGHVKLNEVGASSDNSMPPQTDLALSVLDLSIVDRIVITDGATGEKEYLASYLDKQNFNAVLSAVKEIRASNPVSNRGYSGFAYNVELYYDYQEIFSFALFPDIDGAYIMCGKYETVGGFDYPARYKLTNPTYEKLDELLGKYFK